MTSGCGRPGSEVRRNMLNHRMSYLQYYPMSAAVKPGGVALEPPCVRCLLLGLGTCRLAVSCSKDLDSGIRVHLPRRGSREWGPANAPTVWSCCGVRCLLVEVVVEPSWTSMAYL